MRPIERFLLKRMSTLRGRLTLFLAAPLLVLVALSVVVNYRLALGPADDAYDHALASSAVALAELLGVRRGHLNIDLPPSAEAVLRTDRLDKVYFAVVDGSGKLIAGDPGLAGLSNINMPSDSADAENGGYAGSPEFSDGELGGQKVRIASFRATGPAGSAVILVAETTLKRELAATHTVAAVFFSDLVLLSSTLLIVFFGVRLALTPLDELGYILSRRKPADLRPLPDAAVPGEAKPLVGAINHLMTNVRHAHEAQQAFLSNAAHQLRTPIAGLQTQLELALDRAQEEERPRIKGLLASSRRLSHLTNQMLALARSSPEADLGHEFQRVDLASLCEAAASDFIDAALARDIDLGFETEAAPVSGSPWLLRELLANLLDNAITYTQAGGHVTARCGVTMDGAPFLEVEDNGPGIPAEIREKVFERFFRAPEQGEPGTGLGLAIVREAAERHGAVIVMKEPESGSGVCFRIEFPVQTG